MISYLEFIVCERTMNMNNEVSFVKYFVTTILIFNIIPIGQGPDPLFRNIPNKIQMILKMLMLLFVFEAFPHVGTAQSRAGKDKVTKHLKNLANFLHCLQMKCLQCTSSDKTQACDKG